MSATSLVLVLVAAILLNLVVNAAIISFTGRRFRLPQATFWRGLILAVAIPILALLAWAVGSFFGMLSNISGLLVLLVAVLLLEVYLFHLILRAPTGKTFAVWGISRVAMGVFGVGLFFLLSWTVVGAYRMPTGSMADTILGYHKEVMCPKCGYIFSVNCGPEADAPDEFRRPVVGCTCPNCRELISLTKETRDPRRGMRGEVPDYAKYPVQNGDGFLIGKWPFGLGVAPPARFDVIVFEYPEAADRKQEASEDDKTKGEPIIYVKRLVGLPGETVAIHYGRLYLLDADKALRFDDGPPDDPNLRKYEHMHVDSPEAMRRWERGEFQILRKPPELVLGLRHIVYDNDHPASDLMNFPRWVNEGDSKSWSADDFAHTFRHAGTEGSRLDWLHYRHLLRDPNQSHTVSKKTELITDFMGYDSSEPQALHWAGDLMIDCEVTIDKPQGRLVLELSRGISRFRAVFDLASGDCTLKQLKEHEDKEPPPDDAGEELAKKPTELKKPGTYHVRFANVDDRLLLWVDRNLPFGDGVSYTPSKKLGPYPNDLQPASIGVQGGVTIGKLQLWRDTYYTHMDRENGGPRGDVYPASVDFGDPESCKALRLIKPMTMYVQPGHYLCLGDNSPSSSDSRLWGLVPNRLMIGRAVLRYSPLDRVGWMR